MRWAGWGVDADRMALSDEVLGLLQQGLGLTPGSMPVGSGDYI